MWFNLPLKIKQTERIKLDYIYGMTKTGFPYIKSVVYIYINSCIHLSKFPRISSAFSSKCFCQILFVPSKVFQDDLGSVSECMVLFKWMMKIWSQLDASFHP